MSAKKLTSAEEVFNYLKRNDLDFKKLKEDSEYPNSWNRFKDAMLSDKLGIKYLEGKIDECNQTRSNNYSEAQLTKKARLRNKKRGLKNVESGHLASLRTTEHQIKAGNAGKEIQREIRAKRKEEFVEFMMNNLPNEFTFDDIYDIRNNNLDNTLFHKTWKIKKPLADYVVKCNFIKEAVKLKLIVKIQTGNQHKPTIYHKINEIPTVESKQKSVTEQALYCQPVAFEWAI
jgi:hypothetical protein